MEIKIQKNINEKIESISMDKEVYVVTQKQIRTATGGLKKIGEWEIREGSVYAVTISIDGRITLSVCQHLFYDYSAAKGTKGKSVVGIPCSASEDKDATAKGVQIYSTFDKFQLGEDAFLTYQEAEQKLAEVEKDM